MKPRVKKQPMTKKDFFGQKLNLDPVTDKYGLKEIKDVDQCDEDCEQLKNTSDWYMQIQLTAWATKADYAILFLYSGKAEYSKCIEVGLKPEWA